MIRLYAGGNTQTISLEGLRNDEGEVNGALVSVQITSRAGDPVPGVSWPLTLSPEGSGGDYSAVLSAAAEIVAGKSYRVTITVDSGGNQAEFTEAVVAKSRGMR